MGSRFIPIAIGLTAIAATSAFAAGTVADKGHTTAATAVDLGPSGLPIPRFVALRTDEVRARFGPSFDYPVAYEFSQRGLPLKVIAEDMDNVWRRVEDRDGHRMWIHRSMLSGNSNGIVRDDSVLRSSPRAGARGRARLAAGVITDIETCDGNWCRVKADGYRGWIERDALWGAPI